MKKRTYTPKEVAQMIDHDASTVNRWCKGGRIEARKPFGRWVISRGALLALLFSFGLLGGESLEEYRAMQKEESVRIQAMEQAQDTARRKVTQKQPAQAARKTARRRKNG